MAGPLDSIGRMIARYLARPSRSPAAAMPSDPNAFSAAVQPGDVILVDGRQRISTAIKYLTQSTWSHAALCIAVQTADAMCEFVEADALDGVRVVGAEAFEGLHLRICRPVGLGSAEIDAVCSHARERIGHRYDLRNVVDLARYLFPTPPVPSGWRRRMIALGSGEPTRAICSSLIAQAFQSIRYPILPSVSSEMRDDPDCRACVDEIFHIRHHSLFTPRDFDVSPYFVIVKPIPAQHREWRTMRWSETIQKVSPTQ